MNMILILLIQATMLLPGTVASNPARQQDSAKSPIEQEIRAALCELDSQAYDGANKRLQRLLQSDPNNADVQKLILAVRAQQIKPGDRSADNVARIKSAITGYQQALTSPQFTATEKERIDKFIPLLYGWISRDEQQREMQRRAADTTRTARQRSEAYSVLASQSWNCSFSITENPENKLANPGGKGMGYKKPKRQQDFDAAQTCVKSGLEEIEQAIALDPNNDSAWSYQGNLLLEASKLAEMEGDVARKANYKQQSDQALKIARELSDKLEAEREKAWAEEDRARKNRDAFTPEQADAMARELVDYRRETPLADAINSRFMPQSMELTTLVAPVPIPEEKSASSAEKSAGPTVTSPRRTPAGCFREVDGPAQVGEKRNWKSFTPAEGDLTVDLPDNVCERSGGYLAASEGVMYSISSISRPSIPLSPGAVDGTLNTLVRTFAGMRSSAWLGDGAGNSFEMKLISKEQGAGDPRKLYSYARLSCSVRKESVLLVLATKAHFYTIDVSGAGQSDSRVQRFLESLKVK
jgi:tetratricopeptide (TPR) repeat protein